MGADGQSARSEFLFLSFLDAALKKASDWRLFYYKKKNAAGLLAAMNIF